MRYHCLSVLSVLAAVPLGSLAKPLSLRWDDMHIKHSWETVPKNWESLGRPPSDSKIDLYIALKHHHENALIDALYEVSEPGHPKYGAHLSKDQVAELVAPHPETLELVNSWLEHHGIPSSSALMTHGGNTLMLKGVFVTQANALLDASYELYRHVERRNETIIRTVGYALPAILHEHVRTVVPTTTFVPPPTHWQTPRNLSGGANLVKSALRESATMLSRNDANHVTPAFLRWLYDTSTYTPAAMDRNSLGIAGYLNDYPNPADLATFMRYYRSDAADASYATFALVQVNNGGFDPSNPHTEANQNIQYAEAMSFPTPHIFYSTGQGLSGTDDWFLSWLGYILDQPKRSIPQTISTSYVFDEDTLPKEYAMYVCDLFAQLGARGVSVIFPTGNDGVGHDCVAKDGSIWFRPKFPATCPWVTAVGGTTSYEPEIAASISGGGFSNYFLRPGYQARAVDTFFQDPANRYRGLYFKIAGRGIPDIAAQAIGFQSVFNGNPIHLSGTSNSAPVVAAIISLLNDWLLSRGMAPLGFLNPWLYSSGSSILMDITSGSNPGCSTNGFSASTGWDPVTGLGSPAFRAMQISLW